jgi:hypothetical protein
MLTRAEEVSFMTSTMRDFVVSIPAVGGEAALFLAKTGGGPIYGISVK